MLAKVAALVFVIMVSGVRSWSYNRPVRTATVSRQDPARCISTNKPCRMNFEVREDNGTLIHSSNAYTCSCNLPARCPDDWTDRTYVINRTLVSLRYRMSLNLMFCQDIRATDTCEGDETAVILSGWLEIPYDIHSNICRCPNNAPLVLKERTVQNFKTYHHYACSGSLAQCGPSDTCMVTSAQTTSYQCTCPSNTHCDATGSSASPRLGRCVNP